MDNWDADTLIFADLNRDAVYLRRGAIVAVSRAFAADAHGSIVLGQGALTGITLSSGSTVVVRGSHDDVAALVWPYKPAATMTEPA